MYTDILGVSPVSADLLFEDEKKSTIFTTHKMRREEGRASITLPPMADTVADEVDDVVMRRDEGGLDGCYAMGCVVVAAPCCLHVAVANDEIFEICWELPREEFWRERLLGGKSSHGSRSSHGSFFDVR